MDNSETGEVREAVQTIAEAAGRAEGTEAALEAALEAQEAAEDAAEEIAEAAMEAARMQVIEALRTEIETWRSGHLAEHERLQTELLALRQELASLMERVNNPPQVAVVTKQTDPSSIPPPSQEAPPETTTAVVVNPDAVTRAASEGHTSPEAPKPRRARFL